MDRAAQAGAQPRRIPSASDATHLRCVRAQMLSYANKDDGTFWIEYKDFCAHMTKARMRRPHLGHTLGASGLCIGGRCTCAACLTTCGLGSPSSRAGWTRRRAGMPCGRDASARCRRDWPEIRHPRGRPERRVSLIWQVHQPHLVAVEQPVDPQDHSAEHEARHQAHAARRAQDGGARPPLLERDRLLHHARQRAADRLQPAQADARPERPRRGGVRCGAALHAPAHQRVRRDEISHRPFPGAPSWRRVGAGTRSRSRARRRSSCCPTCSRRGASRSSS